MKVLLMNRRFAVAGIAAAALAACAATVAIAPAHASRGSCVNAIAPYVSSGSLVGRARASHGCGGRGKMYVLIQARYGRQNHVYTLASSSTSGTVLVTATQKCPFRGTWHVWTFATRGFKTDTSGVTSYSCRS